jgi:hypothetical protein
MPHSYRQGRRLELKRELTNLGLSEEEAEKMIDAKTWSDHLTAQDVANISEIFSELRLKFETKWKAEIDRIKAEARMRVRIVGIEKKIREAIIDKCDGLLRDAQELNRLLQGVEAQVVNQLGRQDRVLRAYIERMDAKSNEGR